MRTVRGTISRSTGFQIAWTGILLFAIQPLMAQKSPTAFPVDPDALVKQAIQLNGLTGLNAKTWRLRASFREFKLATRFSEEKNIEGTYEELWAASDKYKQSFTDDEYNQTVFRTPDGKAIAGTPHFILGDLRQIHEFFQPAEYLKQLAQNYNPEFDPASVSSGESVCIRTTPPTIKSARKEPLVYRFCFDSTMRLVRFSINGDDDFLILFYGNLYFNGRMVPTDIELRRHGIVRQTAHLESLEVADGVDDAEFQPPIDAYDDESDVQRVYRRPPAMTVSPWVAENMLDYHVGPIYPPEAKAAGISGTVVLSGTIGTDGLIHDLHTISGPPALRRAARDAVQAWRFRPYTLNDEKIPVGTTFKVVFILGGR